MGEFSPRPWLSGFMPRLRRFSGYLMAYIRLRLRLIMTGAVIVITMLIAGPFNPALRAQRMVTDTGQGYSIQRPDTGNRQADELMQTYTQEEWHKIQQAQPARQPDQLALQITCAGRQQDGMRIYTFHVVTRQYQYETRFTFNSKGELIGRCWYPQQGTAMDRLIVALIEEPPLPYVWTVSQDLRQCTLAYGSQWQQQEGLLEIWMEDQPRWRQVEP